MSAIRTRVLGVIVVVENRLRVWSPLTEPNFSGFASVASERANRSCAEQPANGLDDLIDVRFREQGMHGKGENLSGGSLRLRC